jgi:hypothetical protein
MSVVVGGILAEDCSQVLLAGDEDPVEAFPSHGADPALGVRVGARRLRRRLRTSMPAAANTVSKTAVNLASRSRSRNRNRSV